MIISIVVSQHYTHLDSLKCNLQLNRIAPYIEKWCDHINGTLQLQLLWEIVLWWWYDFDMTMTTNNFITDLEQCPPWTKPQLDNLNNRAGLCGLSPLVSNWIWFLLPGCRRSSSLWWHRAAWWRSWSWPSARTPRAPQRQTGRPARTRRLSSAGRRHGGEHSNDMWYIFHYLHVSMRKLQHLQNWRLSYSIQDS